jgi:hypothetical protein
VHPESQAAKHVVYIWGEEHYDEHICCQNVLESSTSRVYCVWAMEKARSTVEGLCSLMALRMSTRRPIMQKGFIIGMLVHQNFMHQLFKFVGILIHNTSLFMWKEGVHDSSIFIPIELSEDAHTQLWPSGNRAALSLKCIVTKSIHKCVWTLYNLKYFSLFFYHFGLSPSKWGKSDLGRRGPEWGRGVPKVCQSEANHPHHQT